MFLDGYLVNAKLKWKHSSILFFDFYFKKILPKIGGLFSDKSAYEYLPQSVSTMPSGHDFQNMLETAGFHQIEQIQWLSGATRLFKAVKK